MAIYMSGRALPPLPGEQPLSVDFLLPTGLIVPMECSRGASLRDVKEQLYREAKNYPLFSLLKDQGFYNFMGITLDGGKDEFVNESKLLSDLDLFVPMLKLVERQGDQNEKLLNAEISNLIGRRLHDFDVMGAEVQDFRRNTLMVCEEAVNKRNSNELETMHYAFPPSLVAIDDDDGFVDAQELELDIYFTSSDGKKSRCTIQVDDLHVSPSDIVEIAMITKELKRALAVYSPKDLVLKVVGLEDYLLELHPLSHYKYIRQCVAKNQRPQLSVKIFRELVPVEKDKFIRPVHAGVQANKGEYGSLSRAAAGQFVSIWEAKDTYKMKIISAKNVNVPENHKVYIRAGIYHGAESLCMAVTTSRGAVPERAEWNEILEFDIPAQEIPRAAKLCFVILGATESAMLGAKKRKKKQQIVAVSWVNTTVFDYACKMQTGPLTLHAWPLSTELEDSVHYMGSTVLNPNTTECVTLEVDILRPSVSAAQERKSLPIMYPSEEQIKELAAEMSQAATPAEKFPMHMIQDLQKVVDQDPLAQLDEQDKELIWRMRYVCVHNFSQSLPKLLQSISWNNKGEVAQLYVLLSKWKQLSPESAMELLDYQYADVTVRNFAVNCLEVLSDNQLLMYLLQLVQVLKFELYLDCSLGQLLLRRGLCNKEIGHFLFWHLRSEMHLPTVSVRYGLMLEAYCRGCGGYMKELSNQLLALSKMKQASDLMQGSRKKTDDPLKCLQEPSFTSAMTDLTSPLNLRLHCKGIKVDKCEVMDSKMRPLWLVFQNQDTLGDDILQIFKNGDDLRQDMLTLQIMGIMDSLWKQADLDLRMTPYGCLSTGDQVGMIEVVLNASTIAKIQKKSRGARGAFDKKLLYQWLKDQNPDHVEFEKAIQNFTYSCAGCCVATYVLGIGDRHSDNIMLRKNGQLVHIDFGHFLGNFKSKFGVKRERVPFVLTDDFIYIITKEGTRDSPEFATFKKICEEAFLKLRQRGALFLNLFTMMLSCGIPELRTRDDISYIRDALCLGETTEAALENFRKKLSDAIRNAWSVSLNWYFHNVARTGN